MKDTFARALDVTWRPLEFGPSARYERVFCNCMKHVKRRFEEIGNFLFGYIRLWLRLWFGSVLVIIR